MRKRRQGCTGFGVFARVSDRGLGAAVNACCRAGDEGAAFRGGCCGWGLDSRNGQLSGGISARVGGGARHLSTGTSLDR